MCSAPKIPKQAPAPERQAMQSPKELDLARSLSGRRRRGMWASVFTGPGGLGVAPSVTGSTGGVTGG